MSEQDNGQQRSDRRDEAEEMARLQEQINNLPVGEHILYMMHSLSALAVDRLGLAPEGAARRDVEQARLAIDAFRALLGVLEEARPTEEIAAHRGVLSQLQLAYVGALGGAEAEPGEQQEGEAPGTAAQPEVEAQAQEAPKAAAEPEAAAASKDEPEAEEKPKKTTAKKPSTRNKPGKPRPSSGGAAKKSSSAGAAKSTKKSSGKSASGTRSAGKGEK